MRQEGVKESSLRAGMLPYGGQAHHSGLLGDGNLFDAAVGKSL